MPSAEFAAWLRLFGGWAGGRGGGQEHESSRLDGTKGE